MLEGALFAVRLPLPVGNDSARVTSASQFAEMWAEGAKQVAQRSDVMAGEVADSHDARSMHPVQGDPPDTP